MDGRQPNLLIISDVHLGADLQELHHSVSTLRSLARLDRELSAFFDYYTTHTLGGRPWRLIINGDLVDFIGIAIRPPDDGVRTSLTAEEIEHGLGSAADHVVEKLRRVVERHASVFRRLAAFVAAGHELVVVRGNHDVEFYWDEVQQELKAQLAAFAFDAGAPSEHAPFLARIQFAPWFYYLQDVVYVEHGHQYDEYCSFEYLLHPVSPADPRRITTALSNVLLREMVNPTHELPAHGHEDWTFFDYARWVVRIGFRATFRVARRYARMILGLLRVWWTYATGPVRAVSDEHHRRMEAFGEAVARGLNHDLLAKLYALRRKPVTRSIVKIMTTLFLDRIVLALGVGALATTGWLLGLSAWVVAIIAAVATAGAVVASIRLDRWRNSVLNATAALRHSAGRIAGVLSARFVVMGHTHRPVAMPLGNGDTWYYNVGTWASEPHGQGQDEKLGLMTHLVIAHEAGAPRAQLLEWDQAGGRPRPFGGA